MRGAKNVCPEKTLFLSLTKFLYSEIMFSIPVILGSSLPLRLKIFLNSPFISAPNPYMSYLSSLLYFEIISIFSLIAFS